MALNRQQEEAIQREKEKYAAAKANNDYAGMRAANEAANAIRTQAGVAIQDSSKGDAQWAANRGISTTTPATTSTNKGSSQYKTQVWTPEGNVVDGYIQNGQTYLSNGQRIGEGYTSRDASGRYWTIQNGKGVETRQPITPISIEDAYKKKYEGDQYVVRDGLNIDMKEDYSALMEKYKDNPQILRILEEARNAKIAILAEAGAETYGGPTYNYADVPLVDDINPYDAYIAEQERLRDKELATARNSANLSLAELDNIARSLGLQNADELRTLWVNSQLDQKALGEILAARGITGGGAETAMLGLDSAYRMNYANQMNDFNNRVAEVEQERAGVRTDLATTMNAIRNAYGESIADAYYKALQDRAIAEESKRQEIINMLGL